MRPNPSRTSLRRYLPVIILMLLAAVPAWAQKEIQARKDPARKDKVIVYHFQNTGKSTEFGYYSYIIPENIGTDLKRVDQFKVQTFPVVMEFVEPAAPDEQKKNRIRLLADRGKEFDAQYVITGSFAVEDRTIRIKTQIFDVRLQKIRDLNESSEELGALLLVIIDQLSTRINSELQKDIEVKKIHATASPFLPFYERIKGATLGMSYGQVSVNGDWGDIYREKATLTSVYMSYDLSYFTANPIFKNLTGAIQFDYLGASNDGRNSGGDSNYLNIRALSFVCAYSYPLSPAFSAILSGGLGGSYSTLEIMDNGSSGPPSTIHSATSIDPYLSLSAGLIFQFSHLQVTTGFSWKTVAYSDVFMNMTLFYFGFGFML